MKRAILCSAVLALSAGVTQASILSVDLNGARGSDVGTTYTGNGVLRADGSANDDPAVGSATGHWDGITFSDPNTPTPSSGLLDSSSNATGVTLAFANWGFQDNCPGCNYAHGNPANMPLLDDYLGVANASAPLPTMTIGGLTDNATYTLYIYGTNGGSGAGSAWSVNGSGVQNVTGNGPSPFSTFSNGNDYTKFTVAANGSGNLVVTGNTGPNGTYVILNGFQLSPVPEPASLGLLGLGAVGLMARRRRA